MEISKGDKIVLVNHQGYKELGGMTDYFEIVSIQEVHGKLRIQTKFKYNSDEAYTQGVELAKLKKGRNDEYFVNFNFTRPEALKFIRKYEHKYLV